MNKTRIPTQETTIPMMRANHKTTNAYWYKTFCESSQTNLCLLAYDSLMSLAEAWTSQYPNGGRSSFPAGKVERVMVVHQLVEDLKQPQIRYFELDFKGIRAKVEPIWIKN